MFEAIGERTYKHISQLREVTVIFWRREQVYCTVIRTEMHYIHELSKSVLNYLIYYFTAREPVYNKHPKMEHGDGMSAKVFDCYEQEWPGIFYDMMNQEK